MADPFDLNNGDVQQAGGLGGISPDFWRNLATFGAQTAVAANARNGQGFLTYGNGAAGPLGAGFLGASEQARQNQLTRSQLGLQGAQLQGAQLSNVGHRFSNAVQRQNYNMIAPLYGTAPLDENGNPMAAMPATQQPSEPASTDGVSPYAAAVFGVEGGPRANPASSAKGYGQFIDGTWNSFAQANPQVFQGMTPEQVSQARFDPKIAAQATDWLATTNAPILQQNGVQATPGTLAMAHYLGPVPAAAIAKADPKASAASVLLNALPADKAQAYLAANPTLQTQTAGDLQQKYARLDQGIGAGARAAPAGDPTAIARGVLTGQISPNQLTPQQAGAAAMLVSRVNPEMGKELLQFSLAGPKATATSLGELPAYAQKAAIDTSQTGPRALATAQNQNVDARQGAMTGLRQPDGSLLWVKNPNVVKIKNADGSETEVHVSPPAPGSPPGTPGEATTILGPNNQPIQTQIPLAKEHFLEQRGKDLAEQFHKIDADAAQAVQSNYLFDNLRNDSKSWEMGKFADFEGDARAYLSAIAHTFGIATPELDHKLADYQSFNKTAGSLLRTAVHDTSSRAAVQEYNLIGATLPQPTTSERGFAQIADQWQSLSDYQLAKQKFASGYEGDPQKLNVEFNSKFSPSAFLLNRMSQTPSGQQDMAAMVAQAQKTPEGRLTLKRMMQVYKNTRDSGYFEPIGGQ